MKIAVEVSLFGHVFSDVVEYPGVPQSQAEVIQWLMYQTDFKWADYENAPAEQKLIYKLNQGMRP
ncbi:MAG: hypothetical protein ACNI3A_01545 [Desulfovibrio sp.]|uniref:hypothetical protein n=1 Tax=Desulfovibrio sp. 7SRBS1 TaxID=3378064 RepID=UPI003B41BCB2